MAEPTEPTGSRSVFEGTVLRLQIEDWPGHPGHEVVHHPGAAAVLPLLPSNEVLLVRQFRPAIRQTLTEIPAGLLDVEGEDALTCASRELFEETGYRHVIIEFSVAATHHPASRTNTCTCSGPGSKASPDPSQRMGSRSFGCRSRRCSKLRAPDGYAM